MFKFFGGLIILIIGHSLKILEHFDGFFAAFGYHLRILLIAAG